MRRRLDSAATFRSAILYPTNEANQVVAGERALTEMINCFCFIALQLIEFPYGDGMEVVFAGGRRELMHNNQTDPEYPDRKGERLDGRDLIQEWVDKYYNSKYVWNKSQFDQIDVQNVDHVLGTWSDSRLLKCTKSRYAR